VPFVLGATVGFTGLLFFIGLGLSESLSRYPTVLNLLGLTGGGFIIYLGVRLIQSSSALLITTHETPSFLSGALLQWLNPKAWGACLAGVSAFGVASNRPLLLLFTIIYFFICFAGIALWALVGARAVAVINTSRRIKIINTLMGIGLVVIGLFLAVHQLLAT
jgi:threonine/homoserine/homoserine lactone efflux protein